MTDSLPLQNTNVNVRLAYVKVEDASYDIRLAKNAGPISSTGTCTYTGDSVIFPPQGVWVPGEIDSGDISVYKVTGTYYTQDAVVVQTDLQADNGNYVWFLLYSTSTSTSPGSKDAYLDGDGFLISPHSYVFNNYPPYPMPYPDTTVDPFANPYLDIISKCYLSGVQIQTEAGLKNIEDISPGDNVITWLSNLVDSQPRQVIWCGHGNVVVNENLPDDMAGWPVRICKNAITDNVPCKDMLVTGEHGLFLNGKFVPARMLVNGMSIIFDKSIKEYTYYHIETQHHAIIKADGMWSETYLDVGGNRLGFELGENVIPLNRNLRWEENGAALIAYERDFVEPLFRSLAKRAIDLGYKEIAISPELTNEHNLHLLTNNGERIEPSKEWNGHISFVIPAGITDVTIMSRRSRPSDVIGPFENQRNTLGVAIGNIYLFDQYGHKLITEHLTKQDLHGWYNLEWEDTRWTRGKAYLPLGERDASRSALLILHVKAAGPYLVKSFSQYGLCAS